GKLDSNSTCLAYAPGPRVANALETKCSTRNAPTGMMPLSEWSLRSRNECPCPARRGGTPSWVLTGAEGLAVVATGPHVLSEMAGEPSSISQPFYTRTPSSCACNRFAPNALSRLRFRGLRFHLPYPPVSG